MGPCRAHRLHRGRIPFHRRFHAGEIGHRFGGWLGMAALTAGGYRRPPQFGELRRAWHPWGSQMGPMAINCWVMPFIPL